MPQQALGGGEARLFTKYYVSPCLSGVQPGAQLYSSLEMETMQEEADTDTGPDILTSAEYANLESEGIALLTRQLQVNRTLATSRSVQYYYFN